MRTISGSRGGLSLDFQNQFVIRMVETLGGDAHEGFAR